ncbi:hypothetical protein ACFLXE_05440 [Chloroflexota bacterium]
MRTLSGTLLAAQKSKGRKPYVKVEYYDSGWTDLTDAVTRGRHVEEDYHAELSFTLKNADGTYNNLSIRGLEIRVGRGYVTTQGNEYSLAPSLWVTSCGPDTETKKSVVIVYAVGIFDILANSRPDQEVKYNEGGGTNTIKDILADVISRAGFELGTSISEDSLIDTVCPEFTLTTEQDYLSQIVMLLSQTECELLPQTNKLHIIHTQDSDASCYTYGTDHVLYSNVRRTTLFRPNKITVYSILSDGTVVQGSYTDPDTGGIVVYEDTRYTSHLWGVDSAGKCQAMAQDLVERFKRRGNKGLGVVSMNCGQELWDVVTISDPWNGQVIEGRVGRLEAVWEKGQGIRSYVLGVGLGAWVKADPEATPEEIFQKATQGNSLANIPGTSIRPYTIDPQILRRAMQSYDCDIEPDRDHANYTWEQVKWNAGSIHFADGHTLSITGGTINLTSEGYGDDPVWLYFLEGNSTLQHTDDWGLAVGPDRDVVALVQRAEQNTSDDKASWDGLKGKAGVMNTRVLTAAIILAQHIRAGELVIGGKVTGNLADLDEKNTSSLDQVADYKLVTDAEKSGAGYAYSGLDVDGFVKKVIQGAKMTGTPAVGLNMTPNYMGYYTGSAWNVYIKSDGKFMFKGNANNYITWDGSTFKIAGKLETTEIVAGKTLTVLGAISGAGGKFLLDNNILTLKGQAVKLQDINGNNDAWIFVSPSGELKIMRSGEVDVECDGFDLRNADWMILPKLAAAPAGPEAAQSYYDTVLNKARTYDGGAWKDWW